MRSVLPLAAAILVLLATSGFAWACGADPTLSLSIEPPHLVYPGALPKQGYSFSELLFVKYPASLANSTITIQYYAGSQWLNLTSFRANSVGFTQLYVPVTAYWAHTGNNTLRAVSGPYVSNTVVLQVTQNGDGYTVDGAIYAVLVGVPLTLILLSDRLRSRRLFWAVFALYVVASPFTGQRYDMYFLITSGIRILEHVNPFDPGNPPVYPFPLKWAYPPLYPLYSALAFEVYSLVTHTPVPSVQSTVYPGYYTATYSVWRGYVTPTLPVLAFLIKLPMLLSFYATYRVLAKRVGGKAATKYWALNPLAFLVVAVWGQLDPISVALTLLSLDSYLEGRETGAYLWAALGGAVKLWPAALIPIYLTQKLRLSGSKAAKPFAVGVLPVAALSIAIYAAFGHTLQALWILVYARGVPTYAGEFSVNGLTWQWILYLLRSPPIPLFLAAGPIAYASILYYAYRHPETSPIPLLVLVILTLFLTYNYVNPQYFLWIVPLLVLEGRRVSAWVYTALPLIFVGLSYNVFYFVSPAILYDTYAPSASIAEQLKLAFFYNYHPLFIAVSSVIPLAAYIAEFWAQTEIAAQTKQTVVKTERD